MATDGPMVPSWGGLTESFMTRPVVSFMLHFACTAAGGAGGGPMTTGGGAGGPQAATAKPTAAPTPARTALRMVMLRS